MPADDRSESPSGAAERIRQMLVTAENVSKDIRREANEEAARYLAQRRREADAMVDARREHLEQALETLRSEAREIERWLTAVTAAVERALAAPVVAEPSAPAPAAAEATAEEPAAAEPAPEPEAVEAPAAEQLKPDRREQESDGGSGAAEGHARQRAVIRATQLAVQGVERDEVQRTLEREFKLDDTAAIVEEILGSH